MQALHMLNFILFILDVGENVKKLHPTIFFSVPCTTFTAIEFFEDFTMQLWKMGKFWPSELIVRQRAPGKGVPRFFPLCTLSHKVHTSATTACLNNSNVVFHFTSWEISMHIFVTVIWQLYFPDPCLCGCKILIELSHRITDREL